MLTLGRLLDELGPSVLDLVAGRITASTPVHDVSYYDPLESTELTDGSIILCPGIAGAAALQELLEEVSSRNVVGLVLRSADAAPRESIRGAVNNQIAIFELGAGITWRQLIVSTHRIVGGHDLEIESGPEAGGLEDLFGLANAVAQMVDAPVTFEDLGSKVLAYSDDQRRADEARKASVLARHVSQSDTDFLRSEGYFNRIYARDEVVHVPTEGIGGTMPRAAVRLHHRGQLLGSIWAATDAVPDADMTKAMLQAAAMVAPHVARLAAAERAAQSTTTARVVRLLAGGPAAREEAFRIGISRTSWFVVAITPWDSNAADDGMREAAVVLGSHLQANLPMALSAPLDGRLYSVVPLKPGTEEAAVSIIRNFVLNWSPQALLAMVGTVVGDPADIPSSRKSAEQALRAALGQRRQSTDMPEPFLARASEMQNAVLIQRLTDMVVTEGVEAAGPLRRLAEYDGQHDGDLILSLRAWLNAFGDVKAAASTVHVHPNTFRYRLQRVAEIGEVDLHDSEARFSLMLQLRVFYRDFEEA